MLQKTYLSGDKIRPSLLAQEDLSVIDSVVNTSDGSCQDIANRIAQLRADIAADSRTLLTGRLTPTAKKAIDKRVSANRLALNALLSLQTQKTCAVESPVSPTVKNPEINTEIGLPVKTGGIKPAREFAQPITPTVEGEVVSGGAVSGSGLADAENKNLQPSESMTPNYGRYLLYAAGIFIVYKLIFK